MSERGKKTEDQNGGGKEKSSAKNESILSRANAEKRSIVECRRAAHFPPWLYLSSKLRTDVQERVCPSAPLFGDTFDETGKQHLI